MVFLHLGSSSLLCGPLGTSRLSDIYLSIRDFLKSRPFSLSIDGVLLLGIVLETKLFALIDCPSFLILTFLIVFAFACYSLAASTFFMESAPLSEPESSNFCSCGPSDCRCCVIYDSLPNVPIDDFKLM